MELEFAWDLLCISNGSMSNYFLLNETIEMTYLYVQIDIWVNEKLIVKVYPMSWKIKGKCLSHMGKKTIWYLVRKEIFAAASKLALLLSPFNPNILRCSEIGICWVVFVAARSTFAAASILYLDSSVCIYFEAFQLIFCIFIAFVTCNKNT